MLLRAGGGLFAIDFDSPDYRGYAPECAGSGCPSELRVTSYENVPTLAYAINNLRVGEQ